MKKVIPAGRRADTNNYRMMPMPGRHGVEVKICVSPLLTHSGVTSLYPDSAPCSLAKYKAQRAHCECSESIDVGKWWSRLHGCLYCYGRRKYMKNR